MSTNKKVQTRVKESSPSRLGGRMGAARRISRSQLGMTLVEIMVVVTVLALMATAISVSVVNVVERSRVSKAKMDIKTLSQALDFYYAAEGSYPTQSEGINALLRPPRGGAPYLSARELPEDPWNNPYVYRFPGRNNPNGFDICSRGPDRQEGTEEDICND